jgi:hypothetical protein
MNVVTRFERGFAGASLIGAALLFWLSWYLMPLPGTTDAAFILEQVRQQRGSVIASAILQTLSAVMTVPAALLAVRLPTPERRGSTLLHVGAALFLVGAIGNGADAVYHQMAFEMTAPGVDVAAVAPVMTRMQTQDIRLLAPMMLAFFAGAVCLAVGLARASLASARLWQLYAITPLVGILARAATVAAGTGPRPVSLVVLGFFSVALAWTGWVLRAVPAATR